MSVGRQFQIVYTLLDEKMVSAPELARRLEVSVRTIYRDVEALSAAGVPIYAQSGRGGGVSLLEGYTINRSLLSDEERAQLFLALKSVSAADATEGEALLRKLGAIIDTSEADWLSVDFSRWGSQKPDNEKFGLIKRAIQRRRVLAFGYAATSGEMVTRTALPARLMFRSQAWYLLAYCRVRGGWRLFKLHRMTNVQMLDEAVTDMPEPPAEGPAGAPANQDVHLLFAPRMAYRVYDEFDDGAISVLEDGTLSVRTRMPADQWLMSYVLSFGAAVELIEPGWMRPLIREASKSVFEQYLKT